MKILLLLYHMVYLSFFNILECSIRWGTVLWWFLNEEFCFLFVLTWNFLLRKFNNFWCRHLRRWFVLFCRRWGNECFNVFDGRSWIQFFPLFISLSNTFLFSPTSWKFRSRKSIYKSEPQMLFSFEDEVFEVHPQILFLRDSPNYWLEMCFGDLSLLTVYPRTSYHLFMHFVSTFVTAVTSLHHPK